MNPDSADTSGRTSAHTAADTSGRASIDSSTLPRDFLRRALAHGSRAALRDERGRHTYRDLLQAAETMEAELFRASEGAIGPGNPEEIPVAFLVPPGFEYAATLWGIWRAGAMAVPLALSHPERELAYVLDDARPGALVAHPDLAERLRPLAAERDLPLVTTDRIREAADRGREAAGGAETVDPPASDPDRAALMLYTSGTTGKPKGVIHTHGSLRAQARTLVRAWEWTPDDRILLVLPLHHLHGLMNVLLCALWSGAECRVHAGFDAARVWEEMAGGELTLFMAVPTIYHRMISAWEAAPAAERKRWSDGARRLRLMVSGSAALPVSVLEEWRRITGHTLLERYGMTEIGMALSNPLHGERRPGHVGQPLPGVEVRLVGDGGESGEIQVRSPTLFREYHRRPDETRTAFTPDGWFRTGDVARLEDGAYRILGRRSVDIVKCGGYKISALEVEEILREHPLIADCGVVGVPDEEWGQRVAVAFVAEDGAGDEAALEPGTLREWALERLAPYKTPTLLRRVDALPRNAMGKVTKPAIVRLFAGEAEPDASGRDGIG